MPASDSATGWLPALLRNLRLVLFLVLAFGGMLTVYWYFSPLNLDASLVASSGQEGSSGTETDGLPVQLVTQRFRQSSGPVRIGIIAGHMESDTGAVCDDGLTEAEVNLRIATQVSEQLKAAGISVELLSEFDERLDGYSATALLSIHADSCDYFNDLATGYKIAGSAFTDSSALESCMEQSYATATRLPYHANTITVHMTDYHAFRKIAAGTPAIIIETGFLNLDRELLTSRSDIPARGIVQGIQCFLGRPA